MRIAPIALVAVLLASPALAQDPSSSAGTWNGLDDRFQIDSGYFRLSADTVLRFNGRSDSDDVDFEEDLGVDPDVNTFWVDATWRVGRRHQLKLGYTRLGREQPSQTLDRDFVWGGETFNAGLTANTTTGTDILGGYYRFAVFRNDRFEIGPTDRHRLPLAERAHPGDGNHHGTGRDAGQPQPGPRRQHRQHHGRRRRLRRRLAREAPRPAGGLPLHQGEARERGGIGHRLARGSQLLLLPQRGPRRAVQVQPVPLRPRHPRAPSWAATSPSRASRSSCRSCSSASSSGS